MISESTIDKVRELPIETIVGQYVKLAKDGRTSMKGLCPFHSENTPSFSINLNKNLYHCVRMPTRRNKLTRIPCMPYWKRYRPSLQRICAFQPMMTAVMPGSMPTTDGRRTSVQKQVSVMRQGKAIRSWIFASSRD